MVMAMARNAIIIAVAMAMVRNRKVTALETTVSEWDN